MSLTEATALLREWLRFGGAFETISDKYRQALRVVLAAAETEGG